MSLISRLYGVNSTNHLAVRCASRWLMASFAHARNWSPQGRCVADVWRVARPLRHEAAAPNRTASEAQNEPVGTRHDGGGHRNGDGRFFQRAGRVFKRGIAIASLTVCRRAAWTALTLYFCLGWPIVGAINAMQLGFPLCSPKIGLDDILDAHCGSHEIGFINNSPVKNIFIFKLNADPQNRGVYDRAIFPQETKEQHAGDHYSARVFLSYRDADARYLAPISPQSAVSVHARVIESVVLNGRLPDKISSGGLTSIFGGNADERLNIGKRNDALSHLEKNNSRSPDVDVSPNLRLPDALANFRHIASREPQKYCGNEQQSREGTYKSSLILIHETEHRRNYAPNPAGNWMFAIIIGWFLIPIVGRIWRIDWLIGAWFFATGLVFCPQCSAWYEVTAAANKKTIIPNPKPSAISGTRNRRKVSPAA